METQTVSTFHELGGFVRVLGKRTVLRLYVGTRLVNINGSKTQKAEIVRLHIKVIPSDMLLMRDPFNIKTQMG